MITKSVFGGLPMKKKVWCSLNVSNDSHSKCVCVFVILVNLGWQILLCINSAILNAFIEQRITNKNQIGTRARTHNEDDDIYLWRTTTTEWICVHNRCVVFFPLQFVVAVVASLEFYLLKVSITPICNVLISCVCHHRQN